MILSLIRFPFAVVGQAVDIAVQMRAHNRMVAALNEIQPETLNGRMPQEKVPAEVTASGTASAGQPLRPLVLCGCGCGLMVYANTTDPATAAAGADSTHPTPRGASNDPAGALPPVAPAGSLQLAELIAEVLRGHQPYQYSGNGYHWCLGANGFNHATHGDWTVGDWISHVAPLIAERIETASPRAPFTFGDLARAAQVINEYVGTTVTDLTVTQMASLRNLADRLADASEADPTP